MIRNLPAGEHTIPQSNHSISGTARERGIKALQSADEVALARRHGCPPLALIHAALSCSPKNIKSLHASSLFQIPLPQSLISTSGDEHIPLEVQGGNLINVRTKSHDMAIGHGGVVRAIAFLIVTTPGDVFVAFGARKIPYPDGGISGTSGND